MGLGTGRRGMKSPPLLIAVLLACVFVLGINYWITSSRCVELQTRVMELEGRMRRAAAERGAVEIKKNEYEDMLEKQKKQIDSIQSLHSSQMQSVHSQCNREKDSLLNNLTNKDNQIQNLEEHMSSIHKRLEESKLALKELEESQIKKLSYELAQCSSKIGEVKDQCEERLRNAGVNEENVEKIISEAEKPKPTTKLELIGQKDDEQGVKSKNKLKIEIVPPSKDEVKAAIPPPENIEETNIVERIGREKKPSAAPQKSKQEDENADNVQKPENQNDPDNIIAEEDQENDEDQETNKEVERENLVNMDSLQEDDKRPKQNEQEENAGNVNDYNGDETNVAEPEAEKQAQLNDNSQNLKVDKPAVGLNKQAAGEEAQDRNHPNLK